MNTDPSPATPPNDDDGPAERRKQLAVQVPSYQGPGELQQLVQDLQLHQAELEMQNEALLVAQAESETAHRRYLDLYELAPVGYVTLNAGGNIEQVNRNACLLLEAPSHQLLQRRFALFVVPSARDEFNQFLHRALTTSGTQHIEIQLYINDTASKYAQLEALREEPTGPGPALRCRLALLDISERRCFTDALTASEARYRSLSENVPGVLCEWRGNFDGTRHFVYVSPRMYGLFGIKPEDAGRFEEFIHPDDRAAYRAADVVPQRSGEPWFFEGRLVVPGQPLRWFRGNTVLTQRDSEGVNYSGLLLDITASKQHEEQLRQATVVAEANTRAKQEFLANMSHEIRTPLHGILGLTELLGATELAPRQAEYLRLLQEAAEHLLAVLNDVLITARLGARRLQVAAKPFDLPTLLRDCAALLRPTARAQGLRLRLAAPAGLPLMLGDAHRLRQVLLNLLGNSLKFTKQGTIGLHMRCLPGAEDGRQRVEFSVTDTGIGIAPETLEAVFEPFVQAEETTDQQYGGTGLGLSISRSLVELLGGTLSATSEVGVGSNFYFVLDLALAPAVASSPPAAPIVPTLTASRALLVEDNSVSRLLVQTILHRWGWAVDTATTGPEALELFQQHVYDVVLMDLRLPELNGTATTARMRQHPNPVLAATPVIAVTAHTHIDDDTLRTAGFDAYLAKPFREEDLRAVLASVQSMANTVPLGAPTAPLYDLSAVRQLIGDDEVLLQRLISVFRLTTPPILQAMELALAAADWSALADTAHHLKSSLQGMGVASLHRAIRELEAGATCSPTPARAARLVAEVQDVTNQVLAALAATYLSA